MPNNESSLSESDLREITSRLHKSLFDVLAARPMPQPTVADIVRGWWPILAFLIAQLVTGIWWAASTSAQIEEAVRSLNRLDQTTSSAVRELKDSVTESRRDLDGRLREIELEVQRHHPDVKR